MSALNLSKRVKENFEARGYTVEILSKSNDWFSIGGYKKRGDRRIFARDTYRHNGTAENVTVTLEIIETLNVHGCGKIIAKIKIPKNASDRVLNNRIDKAISIMKTGIVI